MQHSSSLTSNSALFTVGLGYSANRSLCAPPGFVPVAVELSAPVAAIYTEMCQLAIRPEYPTRAFLST